ncbi:hypothetical protein ACWCPJ_10190 [Streptomyces collinus]|uniref:hypothetical protein n=1 Tax=Streptomyces collinus TaxID=42684 RepID=UPI0036CC4537
MMKTLLTTAALTVCAAALAAPAHADGRAEGHWTATGTARCAGDLALPALASVAPLPKSDAAPACGADSLLHHGR